MGSSTWFRQYEVTLSKNVKLLLRRPFHLVILLLSSVISVIFAWLAGRDARGPTGEFPPLTNCGKVDPYYIANVTGITGDYYYYSHWSLGEKIPMSLNEPWRAGLPVWLVSSVFLSRTLLVMLMNPVTLSHFFYPLIDVSWSYVCGD